MTDKVQSHGMSVTLESPDGALLVEAYGEGGFRLMGRRVEGSLYVKETGFFPVSADDLAGVESATIDGLVAEHGKPEILLIGTGEQMTLLPKALRMHLEEQGIGYDVMSTGAAARTYNVLTIEGRDAAALLVQVP